MSTETEWRKAIADQIRRNCTLPSPAPGEPYPRDADVRAVADWIENPPEWSAFEVPGSKGVALIAAERARQPAEEGYTAEHDRGHAGELATAGAAYAFGQGYQLQHPDTPGGRQYLDKVPAGMWPWAWDLWKPGRSAVRTLVKAGALIAAAIDSLLAEGRR